MGQIVTVVDPEFIGSPWPVGNITKIYPGADGCVWSAEVKVKT